MFYKLLKYSITGKAFRIIKSIYENTGYRVCVNDTLSPRFIAHQGVKQGCCLSPILSNIFQNDLHELFNSEDCRSVALGNAFGESHLFMPGKLGENQPEILTIELFYTKSVHIHIKKCYWGTTRCCSVITRTRVSVKPKVSIIITAKELWMSPNIPAQRPYTQNSAGAR